MTNKQGTTAASAAAPKVLHLFKGSRLIGTDPDGCKVTVHVEINLHTGEAWKRDIHLRPAPRHVTLSMNAEGQRPRARDVDYCGQCQDTIRQQLPNYKSISMNEDLIKEMLDIWDRWHLNDLKAASFKQGRILKAFEDRAGKERWQEMKRKAGGDWYTLCRTILIESGNLEDDGYKFGTAWLVEILPGDIQTRIKCLFPDHADPDKQPAHHKENLKKYKRKTEDEFLIQCLYPSGWETECTEENALDAAVQAKCYRENVTTPVRVIKRRVKVTP